MALSESAFDEQLIECVRLYPVLYMSSSKSNKNKVAKENAWKLIADDLHTTVEECERRWRVLIDQYVKYLKAPKHSGSGAGGSCKKPAFADAMSFIKDTIKHRNTKTNLTKKPGESLEEVEERSSSSSDKGNVEDLDDVDATGSQSPTILLRNTDDQQPPAKRKEPATTAVQPRPKVQRTKKASPKDLELEVVQAIREVSASSKAAQAKPKDECELFADSLVPQLRRLAPRQFAIVKAKVASLLVEVEFGAGENWERSSQGVGSLYGSGSNSSYSTGGFMAGGVGGWGLGGVGPSTQESGGGWGMEGANLQGTSRSWGPVGIGMTGMGPGAGSSNIFSRQYHPWSMSPARSCTPSLCNLLPVATSSDNSATSVSSILRANSDIMGFASKYDEEHGDDQ